MQVLALDCIQLTWSKVLVFVRSSLYDERHGISGTAVSKSTRTLFHNLALSYGHTPYHSEDNLPRTATERVALLLRASILDSISVLSAATLAEAI
jgi:hypothetical protein